MFDNYIIEVRPPTSGLTFQAGIIVRDGGSFRFFAASGSSSRSKADALMVRKRPKRLRCVA